MSNFLAPATVTAALALLLEERIAEDVADFAFTVTTGRPDDPGAAGNARVNIYLYQAPPNPQWRNADLPTRSSGGQFVQPPRVALDLHYLLTFYGNEAELEPQRLLGSAVRILHEQPVLTHAWIDAARASADFPFLVGSDLGNEIERVKFTPQAFTLEEISKLWSIFLQTPYNLSMSYIASVVFVEAKETPSRALPVQERVVEAIPSATAEPAVTPAEIGGLQLWLRSDRGVTYDAAGVSAWEDLSGNGHNAAQDDVLQRPRFVAHGLGRLPVLRFDGVDDRLALDWRLSPTSAGWTVAAVVRSETGASQAVVSFDGDRYWELLLSDGAPSPRIMWQTADSTHNLHVLTADRAFADTQWHALLALFEAGAPQDKQLFVDGIPVGAVNAHGGNPLGSGPDRFGFVGASSNAALLDGDISGRFLNGDLAEVIVFDRALTGVEREQLDRYLAARYRHV